MADELICVDKEYNEVPCGSPSAAFQFTTADLKKRRKALGLPAVQEAEVETEEGNGGKKAKSAPPQNKAVGAPKEDK